MKKLINIITLIIMVSVNLIDPFTYAISTGDIFQQTQNIDNETQKYEEFIENNIEDINNENNESDVETTDINNEKDEEKNGEDSNNDESIYNITDLLEIEGNGSGINNYSISPVIDTNIESGTIVISYNLNGGYRDDLTTEPKNIEYTKNNSGYYIASGYYKTPSKETGCGENEDKKCMFMGRYDQTLTTRWTGNVTENMTVYAKWQEFEDLDVYIIEDENRVYQYSLMDRNVGATEVYNKEYKNPNTNSAGYHFQWGNNYGFKSCNEEKCTDFIDGEKIIEQQNINRNNISPSKYYYGNWVNNIGDWSNMLNLWGGNSNNIEDRQGPCPDGYHINNNDERNSILRGWFNVSKAAGLGPNFSYAFLMPSVGHRQSDGKLIRDYVKYRSSSSTGNNGKIAFQINYKSSYLSNTVENDFSNFGANVRCFKNQDNNTFDLTHIKINGGNSAVFSIIGGEIKSIDNPIKSGYIFDGWYTGLDYLGKKLEVGDKISSNDYLYAKWSECPDGETANDYSEVCIPISKSTAKAQLDSQIIKDLEIYFYVDENTPSYHYTLMDRNMGATEIFNKNFYNQNEKSYGYYYQRGNNYGFPSTGTLDNNLIQKGGKVKYSLWLDKIPSKFSRNIWSNTNSWMNDGSQEKTVYGQLWYGNGTETDRQGPCPNGYYIPSKTEYDSIINQWKQSNTNSNKGSEFAANLLLPNVGYRNTDGGNINYMNNGYYWTSIPKKDSENSEALNLNFTNADIKTNYMNYSYGLPVRCMKQTENLGSKYFNISNIHLNGGSKVVLSLLSSGEISSLSSPVKAGYYFQGWYKDENYNSGSEVKAGDILLTGDHLYAKWGDCPDGYIKINGECQITAEGQKNEQIVEDLDVYILKNETEKNHYTIMDRNMGATEIYNNNHSNPNIYSLGYYYQWGNNYGFNTKEKTPGTLPYITGNTVNISGYSWDKPYESYTFVKGTNWMQDINSINLWGWKDDDILHKQGPCPDGYHVPIKEERESIVTSYTNAKNGGLRLSRYLLLPPAGYRDRNNGGMNGNGNYSYATTSLVTQDLTNRIVYVLVVKGDGDLGISNGTNTYTHEWSSNGIAIRCHKNQTNTGSTAIDVNNIHLNGGTKAILSVLSSGEVIALQNPTRKNSTWIGWYTTPDFSGDAIVKNSIIEPGSDLYANFKCNNTNYGRNGTDCVQKYTITFNSNGGSSVESQKIPKGLTGTKPLDPILDGYTLVYWHLNGSTDEFDFENTPITSNITLIAEREPSTIKHTVTFNAIINSGTTQTGSIEVVENTILNLSNYTATRNGFEFYGRGTTPNPESKVESIQITSDITLYASYYKQYEANFEVQHQAAGTLSSNTGYCTGYNGISCDIIPPTMEINEGYSFDGYTNIPGSKKVIDNYIEGNTYYTVTHNNTPITITFYQNGNGGYGSEERTCYRYNGEPTCVIRSPNITLSEGSSPIGWNTLPNAHSSSWNQNTDKDVSYDESYYAITSKLISATFKSNDDKNLINGYLYDSTKSCTIYNNSTNGCGIVTPKIGPRGDNTPIVVGFTKSKEGTGTATVGSESNLTIYGGEIYYAHTKREKVDLTANWDGNSSTLGDTSLLTGCELPEVYDRDVQPTSCSVDGPEVTPNENTPTFVGFDTTANSTTNNVSYNTGTNKLTLTKSNTNNTWYVITTAPEKTLRITYGKGVGIAEISATSGSCLLAATYNGVSQTGCNVIAPSITVKPGYSNEGKKWTDKTNPSNQVRENQIITLTKDEHYTANAEYEAGTTIINYSIEYELSGGSIAGAIEAYTVEDEITLVNPTWEHHIFVGWTGGDKSSPEITIPTITVTIERGTIGDKKYYAKWYDDYNDNGINDDEEERYSVTIRYEYTKGGEVAPNYELTNQLSGFTYRVASPQIDYYTPDKPELSGKIEGNINEIVKYKPNNDKNGNEIADEEEIHFSVMFISGGNGRLEGKTEYNVLTGLRLIDIEGFVVPRPIANNGYEFDGWDKEININEKITSDIIITAQWKEVKDIPTPSGGGGSSGGGRRYQTDEHNTAENEITEKIEIDDEINNDKKEENNINKYDYTPEQVEAYIFAKSNGITTTKSIVDAKMNMPITRIEMAKMLSYYAINILGKKPDTSKKIKFKDVTEKLDKEYNNGVTLSYQLGIMGINMKNNKFRPNDNVTRAEFATALSRLLFGTPEGKNKSTKKYYEPHIAKLYNEGIIQNTNSELKEKRGYVMIMLMRGIK